MIKLNNKNREYLEKIAKRIGGLNRFIPKKKNKILIYNSTESYQNNYAIFNYLIKNEYNQKYKIYYYMPGIRKYFPETRNVTFKYNLLGALYHYLTSKNIFLDTGNIRVKPSENQIVMNLWHGVPFKAIGNMSKIKQTKLKLEKSYSKIIVPSEGMEDVYVKSFSLENDQVFKGGQPRNDLLNRKLEPFSLLNIEAKQYKKIVMWMTTYRVSKDERLIHTSNEKWSSTNLPLLTTEKNINLINDALAKKNILLIIKHHTTGKTAKKEVESTRNIKIIEEDDYLNVGLQLYEILGQCDALVTDYSSVFIDFLLLNRPIGFIVDDIEDYNESNGFSLDDPLDYMPGNHIENIEDLLEFFDDLVNEKDNYYQERKKISGFFNEYNQDDNIKHILDEMDITI